jgi:hypothetical protein
MPMPIQEHIRTRIEEFLTELDALVRQAALESVTQALQGNGAAASRARRAVAAQAVAGPRRRRKGQKRDPGDLEQLTARLLAFVAKHSGQRIEQIGKAMGTTTKELALPAKKLIAEKKIRTTGTRRATKYFAR